MNVAPKGGVRAARAARAAAGEHDRAAATTATGSSLLSSYANKNLTPWGGVGENKKGREKTRRRRDWETAQSNVVKSDK